MAKTSATPPIPRRRGRRARAVPFLPRNPRRFLRLLATNPKTAARRRSLIASSPSSPPPLPTSKKRKYANQPQTPSSPPHEVETPKKPKRAEDAAGTAEAEAVAVAGKYWAHRHSLFSLYDRGVRMDAEGWYSATPEAVAAAQAARAAPAGLVVDAFAGVGGNSIQFAARGCYVVAVEIDPLKVELAAHNARIYGVEDRIEFVVGDFFRLAPFLKADLVFLSPPWGGPSYNQTPIYTLDMLKPKDGYALVTTRHHEYRSTPIRMLYCQINKRYKCLGIQLGEMGSKDGSSNSDGDEEAWGREHQRKRIGGRRSIGEEEAEAVLCSSMRSSVGSPPPVVVLHLAALDGPKASPHTCPNLEAHIQRSMSVTK